LPFHRSIVFILACGLLASCSSEKELSDSSLSSKSLDSSRHVSGTDGALISITSSNVAAAGYDFESSVMKVQFLNGALYEYYGVPLELWESFLSAQPNPWSTVGYPRLVGEEYQYRRIN
jgi:hypothetical protein